MPYVIHEHEIAAIARLITLLLAPLAFPQLDQWRHEVNTGIRDLLGADSVEILMPLNPVQPEYSARRPAEHTQAFPEFVPPALREGTPISMAGERQQATSMSTAYGDELSHYLASDHHREFDGRSLAILSMLAPALRSGVDAARRHAHFASSFAHTLDEHGVAVLLIGADDAIHHRSRALAAMIACDPTPQRLTDAIDQFAHQSHVALRQRTLLRSVDTVSTPLGRYPMRATRALHDADGHATLITVEPPRQRISTNDELRAGFGLTATEVRVAHALAEGCSNAVIAERLTISVHTVRRHVENVFRKLGVNARAAVAARLVTGGAE